MTALRDREAIDASLVSTLGDLPGVERVAVHRLLGDAGSRHWVTAARWESGALTPFEPVGDLASLPLEDDFPDWRDCLQARRAKPWRARDPVTLFPLAVEGAPGGVIEVHSERALSAGVHRGVAALIQVVGNQLGLLDYSQRDTLTGLLNRKSFDESFYKLASLTPAPESEATEERRHTAVTQYALAVMDIDHFKQVNDRFGHLIGDEVLLLLSQLMGNCFRFYDQLYRFGGEEFVVLLRCGNEADAQRAFDRFRMSVAAYKFPQVEHVTVSVGFTAVRPGDTPSTAVARADTAVYHAKHHGRNQVCCQEALLRDGLIVDDTKSSDLELF